MADHTTQSGPIKSRAQDQCEPEEGSREDGRSAMNRLEQQPGAESQSVMLEALTAVELAMDGISKLDETGHYVFVNQQYAALLGYRPDELVGQSWEITVHPDDRPSVLTAFARMLEIGKVETELRGVKRDGSVCYKHVVLVKQDGAGKRIPGHFCFVRDVTESKRIEALHDAEKQALELVAKGESLEGVLNFVCRAVEHIASPMRCSVMLADEDGIHLSLAAAPNLPDGYNQAFRRIPIGPAIGSCGSAAYFRTVAIAADIATDPLWKDYASVALTHGLKACWSLPIMSAANGLLGILAVYHDEPREPQPSDLKILGKISRITALAIEHARVNEAFRESEARFNAFMRHSPAVSFIKDFDGHYIYGNPPFETLSGLSREDLKAKTVFDFLPAEIATRLSQQDKAVLAGGRTLKTEEALPGPDGNTRHWLVSKFPLGMAHHELIGGVAVDITERKSLERETQNQADRLRLAMDIAKLATWDWNILTNQVIWSENCDEVLDLPRGSFDGTFEAYQQLVHPEDLPRLRDDIQCALSGQKPYHTEHRIVPSTGEMQWIEGNGVVYRDELGRPVRMVGTARNITEQKRMEQVLRLNEERYARATAVGRVGVWELNVPAGTYYGDKNLKAMFGYGPDELSTDPLIWLNLVHPDDQSIAMARWQQVVSQEIDDYQCELRMIKKDGWVIWTEVRAHAVRDRDGQVMQLIGATAEITERKRADEALRSSEQRLEFLLSATPAVIYTCRPSGDFGATFVTENVFDVTGYRREECVADSAWWIDGLHPDDRPRVLADLPSLFDCGRHTHEYRFRHKDGAYRWIRDDLRVVHDAKGHLSELVGCWVDVTEQRQAAEHLLRTKFAMDQAVDAVYWIDPQAKILYTNEAASAMLGYTKEEFLRMTVHDLNPDFPAEVWPAFWSETREKKVVSLETNHRTKDGRQVPIDIRVSFLAYGGQEFHCAFVRDITVRKRVDHALRESQERFELAVSATYDGIWDWNILTGEQYWSDHHLELFGLRPGDLTPTYDLWLSLVHPDDAQLVRQATCRHLETRAPYDIEVRVRMKDGSYRWFRDRGQAVWDASGRPVRMVGSISDVTERRRAEETIWRANAELERRVTERTKELAAANRALEEEIVERKRIEVQLRDQERQLNDAQTIAHLGSWELDVTANRLKWSDETCRIFGLTPQEFSETYEEFLDRVHSDDRAMVAEAYSRSLRRGCGAYEIEHRIVVQGTGEIRVVHEKCIHMRDESGKVMKSVGMVHDITARKRAEEAVRESELRYKLVTEATFDAIALHDNGVLLEVNAGLERMFGYESGELLGRSILDLVADESCDQIVLNMQNGVVGPYEAVGRRKDGTTFPGELVVRPYHYCGKEVRLVAGRDITSRKQLELQLARHAEELERQVAERTSEIAKLEAQRAQTEKLAAVGQMAAAVAHEINNPIAGIRNAFTLVKQAVDPAHPHYEFVVMIDREITRVASIVKNMYQLYRKEPSKVEPVNLSLLLRDLESLFAERLSQLGQTLVVTQVPLRSRLLVPQSDLLQVLMNLIQNGIDSSFEGGTITLSICQDEELVRIRVSDEGSGIPPDVLPHIFDPFFTTKTEKGQKGMGLGLSVSQSLVMAMGGRMEVQTEQGAGSTFSIILPEPAAGSQASGHRNIIQEVLTHET